MFARFLVFASALFCSQAARKQWTSNTNWNNAKNWNTAVIPCSADTVDFNDHSWSYYVLVDDDAVIKELILSPSSEIVIGEGVSISFTNDTDCDTTLPNQKSARKGKENRFIGGDRRNWYDTKNWSPINDESAADNLIPLPCEHDDIVFPSQSYVSVYLDQSVSVKSLRLQDASMSTDSFQAYALTHAGLNQFSFLSGAKITVSGQDCDSCPCGNNVDESVFKPTTSQPTNRIPTEPGQPTEPGLPTVAVELKDDENDRTTIYVVVGSVVGALVLVLIVIILVLAINYRRGAKRIRGSYDNDNDETMGATFSAADQSATLAGFSNPIYSNPKESGVISTKANPLYSSVDDVKVGEEPS